MWMFLNDQEHQDTKKNKKTVAGFSEPKLVGVKARCRKTFFGEKRDE